jgi:predicted RNase H-like HicB family nuclease
MHPKITIKLAVRKDRPEKSVMGWLFNIFEGFDVVLHRDAWTNRWWTISEVLTGCIVANGPSPKEALRNLEERIKEKGEAGCLEALRKQIEDGAQLNYPGAT